MKTLFDAGAGEEIRNRLQKLTPDRQAQWGKMNVAQGLAHLAATMEMALGDRRPPRALVGRLIGRLIKPKALAAPMRQGNPTSPELRISDEREFETERKRLHVLIDRFVAGGPKGCTDHPHPFFGPMTPDEWALQMWKHLDHHLRQFGG
jgi:hypothetical protein